MKSLVIAEKRSVAMQIAAVVGASVHKEGYIEGASYIVSWVRGHLVSLCPPNEYRDWAGPWRFDALPMVPAQWKWEPSAEDGAAAQLKVIVSLMGRGDVDLVVNACDADREGEGIFARVYAYARCRKPVRRFWNTSMVDDEIAKSLREAKPAGGYSGLAAAAEGRAKADWLVGLNGTRAYTTLYNSLLHVGRVQTPTLAMVASRTREADDFTPSDYYQAVLTADQGFELTGERLEMESRARERADMALAEGLAVVKSAKYKDARQAAPKLYDITALQRDANERFGYTAGQSEALLEELYLAKLLTYPRTGSRYITHSEAGSAAAVIPQVAVAAIVGAGAATAFAASTSDMGKVVDGAKVSGHGALLPTELLDAKAFAKLTEEQKNIARLVCLRLLSSTMPPCVKREVQVSVLVAGSGYEASSSVVNEPGWSAVDGAVRRRKGTADQEQAGQKIPEGLAEGMRIQLKEAQVRKGKTSPPRLYTDSTLLSAMQHAGQAIEDGELREAIDDDSSHSGGLGTPATRDSIIEQLVGRGYIARRGRSIRCTEKGFALVDIVGESLKTPELTAKWELELSRVEHGEADLDSFLEGIATYTGDLVAEAAKQYDPGKTSAMSRAGAVDTAPLGKCPLCGADVVDKGAKSKSYQCSSNRFSKKDDGGFALDSGCGWSLQKLYRGKRITQARCTRLLAGKSVRLSGLTSKAGREYAIEISLDADGKIESQLAKLKR